MQAFTLLEMSIVLMVLMALISTSLFVSKKTDDWKLGRKASEALRTVYSAQRMYLADNPTVSVSTLTAALLIPYLPNLDNTKTPPTTLEACFTPPIKSLTGDTLLFVVNDPNSTPPYFKTGSGARYDPSATPPNYTDSLWDVGQ